MKLICIHLNAAFLIMFCGGTLACIYPSTWTNQTMGERLNKANLVLHVKYENKTEKPVAGSGHKEVDIQAKVFCIMKNSDNEVIPSSLIIWAETKGNLARCVEDFEYFNIGEDAVVMLRKDTNGRFVFHDVNEQHATLNATGNKLDSFKGKISRASAPSGSNACASQFYAAPTSGTSVTSPVSVFYLIFILETAVYLMIKY